MAELTTEQKKALARARARKRRAEAAGETAGETSPATMAGVSLLEGLPIVGPAARSAVEHGRAAVDSWKSGKPFHEELKTFRKELDQLEEKHPTVDWLSELGGSIAGFAGMAATPAGAAVLGLRGGAGLIGLASRMGKGAVSTGAISGADVAAREGEAGLGEAAVGAVGGAAGPLVGPVAGRVAGGIGKAGSRAAQRVRSGKPLPPAQEGATTEAVKQKASALYNSVNETGLVVKNGSFKEMAKGLDRIAKDEGFQRALHPRVNRALGEFKKAAKAKGDLRWQDIDGLRKVVGRISKSPLEDERFIAVQLRNHLDDWMGSLKKSDVVAGNVDAAMPLLRGARDTARKGFKAEIIDEAWNKAARAESSMGPALRSEFRRIANNQRLIRQFSSEERELITKVATLSRTERILQVAGDLRSMVAGGLATVVLGAGGAGPAAGVPGVAAGVGLLGARAAEGPLVKSQARRASEAVRPMTNPPPTSPTARRFGDVFPRGAATQAGRPDIEEDLRRARRGSAQ